MRAVRVWARLSPPARRDVPVFIWSPPSARPQLQDSVGGGTSLVTCAHTAGLARQPVGRWRIWLWRLGGGARDAHVVMRRTGTLEVTLLVLLLALAGWIGNTGCSCSDPEINLSSPLIESGQRGAGPTTDRWIRSTHTAGRFCLRVVYTDGSWLYTAAGCGPSIPANLQPVRCLDGWGKRPGDGRSSIRLDLFAGTIAMFACLTSYKKKTLLRLN